MNQRDLSPEERAFAGRVREKARALDPFIPPSPRFDTIESVERATLSLEPRPRGMRPARAGLAAVATVGLAIVLVLAAGSRHADSPAAASPSHRAAASPVMETPETSAPASVDATLPHVVFTGNLLTFAWSPSGARLAVRSEPSESGQGGRITILDRDGGTLEAFPGDDVAWIDDDSYLLLTADGFVRGQVGSTARQSFKGNYRKLVPGRDGYVAIVLELEGRDQYVLWHDGAIGSPRDGVPQAFSRDGSMLAVIHYPRACCAGGDPGATAAPAPPTLDILETATGRSIRSRSEVTWAYGAYLGFSPDGRYVAFDMDAAKGQSRGRLGVMDIASGKLWTVGTAPVSDMDIHFIAWASSGRIEVVGAPGSPQAALPVIVEESLIAGSTVDNPYVFGGPDGTWAAFQPSSTKMTVNTPNGSRTYDLPDVVGGPAAWSPDGSQIAVACGPLSRGAEMSLVLARP